MSAYYYGAGATQLDCAAALPSMSFLAKTRLFPKFYFSRASCVTSCFHSSPIMAKGVPVEYQPVEVQGKKSFGESDTSLCRRRDGETWAGLYYRIFWIVILHLVCCIVLAVTLLCALDGYMAVYPHSSRYHQGKYKLMVSDVTTLISSALVVIKLLVGAWTGTIMWNCAFILLQSQGLALSEINWLLASYIPPIPKHRASKKSLSLFLSFHASYI